MAFSPIIKPLGALGFFWMILGILLTGAALRITIDLYSRDPFLVNLACRPKNQSYEIVLLGDSVIATTAVTDTDKRSIATILSEKTQTNLLNTAQPGAGLLRFKRTADLLKHNQVSSELTIVEFNASTIVQVFDRVAYKLSFIYGETPMPWLNVFSAPFIQAVLLDKSTRTKPDIEELNFNKAENAQSAKGLSSGLAATARPQENRHSIESAKIADLALRHVLTACKAIAGKTLVYATPVNMESIRQSKDVELKVTINRNIAVARSVCALMNVPFLDMHDQLGKNHFTDTSEVHLDDKGRQYVAHKLAHAIEGMNLAFNTPDNKMTVSALD